MRSARTAGSITGCRLNPQRNWFTAFTLWRFRSIRSAQKENSRARRPQNKTLSFHSIAKGGIPQHGKGEAAPPCGGGVGRSERVVRREHRYDCVEHSARV